MQLPRESGFEYILTTNQLLDPSADQAWEQIVNKNYTLYWGELKAGRRYSEDNL